MSKKFLAPCVFLQWTLHNTYRGRLGRYYFPYVYYYWQICYYYVIVIIIIIWLSVYNSLIEFLSYIEHLTFIEVIEER